ncbi:MAG: hypothetical protein LBH38_03970 [Holosporales bacterium]|jgi:hypothetical protein|nr:hypothetical protein [Holosporales bacterium]
MLPSRLFTISGIFLFLSVGHVHALHPDYIEEYKENATQPISEASILTPLNTPEDVSGGKSILTSIINFFTGCCKVIETDIQDDGKLNFSNKQDYLEIGKNVILDGKSLKI